MPSMERDVQINFGFDEQMSRAHPGVFMRWYAEHLLLGRSDAVLAPRGPEVAISGQPEMHDKRIMDAGRFITLPTLHLCRNYRRG